MVSVILLILVIFLWLKVVSLGASVKILEAEVSLLKGGKKIAPTSHDVSPASFAIPKDTIDAAVYKNVMQEMREDEGADHTDVFLWFKENWLLKVGVLMVLAGFGWFISYAFVHDWIGPVGRVMLGFISGALIALFGTYRASKNEVQGNTFSILGSSLVIITALAGQYFYYFFSAPAILSIIFLASAYVAFFAVVSSNEKLAYYGVVMSLIAPYFAHTVFDAGALLYMYLLVISLATTWVAVVKGWRFAIALGITGVLFYTLNTVDSNLLANASRYTILLILYAISLVYLFVGVWSLIKNKIRADGTDMYLTILNTILILISTWRIMPTVWQSLVIAGWMVIYALAGATVFEKTRNNTLFYLHALASILLLGVATSIELSGPTLVIAFAIEAVIISFASYVVTEEVKTAELFGLLMGIPFVFSISSLTSSKWDTGILHADFAVLVVMALACVALGVLYRLEKREHVATFRPSHLSFVMATFYLFALVWLVSHSLFVDKDSAVFMSLLVYTIIGLGTHFIGLFNRHVVLRNYGTTVLTLVVIRLILVDVWDMDLSLRVVTFVVLGLLFISTAFISKKQSAHDSV